jgi:cell division protein FtsN
MADSERHFGPTIDLQGFDLRTDMDTIDEPSRLPLVVVIALVVLAAFGGVVWLAYTQGVERGRQSVSRELTAQEFWKVRRPAGPAYTGLKIYEAPGVAEQPANANAKASAPVKRQAANTIPSLRPTASAAPDTSALPGTAAVPAASRSDNERAGETPAVPGKATPGPPQQRVATHEPTELTKPAAAPPMPRHPITAPDSFATAAPAPLASVPKPVVSAAPPPRSSAPQAPAAASTPAPGPTTGVVLQIGSYKSEAEARQSWQAFKSEHDAAKGFAPEVRQADLGARGTWYRLRMGPFPDKASALETCRKLKADGAGCLLAQ